MRAIFALVGLMIFAMNTTSASAAEAKHEEAVIIHFKYGQKDWSSFYAFENTLETAISKAGVGEYDGNELATDGSGRHHVHVWSLGRRFVRGDKAAPT